MRILNVALVRLHTFMSACILCMFRAQERVLNMALKLLLTLATYACPALYEYRDGVFVFSLAF